MKLANRIALDAVPKVSFVSLGCPKNLVDSEVLLGNLIQGGFTFCEDYEDSDVIIVNTCSFLRESEEESINVIHNAVRLKEEGKVKAVVVAGCLPQRYGDTIRERLRDVDGIMGISNHQKIAEFCKTILREKQKSKNGGRDATVRSFLTTEFPQYEIDRDRLRLTPRHFGYIRVSEGCDHTCAFCIIPKIRGRFRSKPMEVIVDEARELARDGAVEINLIAQDLTMYGLDIYRRLALDELLDKIAEVDGVRWIRLLYCYPTFVNERLIKTIAENPKVVKYIDLPIQHTREKMLRLMRRGITEKKQRVLIETLREKVPNLFIRTTIIVGFPGETEQDFDELAKDLAELRFERLGTFRYSKEDGTRAENMDGHVPEKEKERRFDILMRQQQKIALENNKALIGRKLEIIVEQKENGNVIGRTYGDAPDVDGQILLQGKNLELGSIYKATITAAKEYDLMGRVSQR